MQIDLRPERAIPLPPPTASANQNTGSERHQINPYQERLKVSLRDEEIVISWLLSCYAKVFQGESKMFRKKHIW